MTSSPINSQAPFIATSTYFPEDFEEFRVKFLQLYSSIANNINVRQIGVFDIQEFLTGEQWSTTNPQIKRQTFRKIFFLGAIAPGATSTTAHGINTIVAFTHIYGTAVTNVVDYRPIPFASATVVTDQIQILCTATNVVVTNGATAPAITSAILVLEYLKS